MHCLISNHLSRNAPISTRCERLGQQQVEDSMRRARDKVQKHYGASQDDVIDVLISCDGTWQKRGFSSLFRPCL